MEKSAAYALGYLTNIPLPPEESFTKVAAATGVDADVLKQVFIKVAIGPAAGVLAAAAVPMLGMPLLELMRKQYQGWKNPGLNDLKTNPIGITGGLNPREQSDLTRHVLRETARTQAASRDLQLLTGMYRPAPNPWGGPPGVTV